MLAAFSCRSRPGVKPSCPTSISLSFIPNSLIRANKDGSAIGFLRLPYSENDVDKSPATPSLPAVNSNTNLIPQKKLLKSEISMFVFARKAVFSKPYGTSNFSEYFGYLFIIVFVYPPIRTLANQPQGL